MGTDNRYDSRTSGAIPYTYSDITKYREHEALIKSKGFPVKMIQEENLYKCQVGLYSGKTNAERKAAQLKAKGIDAFVKEV